MPVTADQPAPYAPAKAIIGLIERHRSKGLPSIVDGDVLGRAGISDSLIPRTLQALYTLGLLEEGGKPSRVMEGIRLAPEGDYKMRLKEWLSEAYADALVYVDPATATETDIRDAFRSYKPTGQQSRMVSLFQGLFAAAGETPQKGKSSTPRVARVFVPKPNPHPKPKEHTPDSTRRDASLNGLPPALSGLLASLPTNGWPQDRRDQFVATFGAVLDFCVPIVSASSQKGGGLDTTATTGS